MSTMQRVPATAASRHQAAGTRYFPDGPGSITFILTGPYRKTSVLHCREGRWLFLARTLRFTDDA
jgi:hypothetical protein